MLRNQLTLAAKDLYLIPEAFYRHLLPVGIDIRHRIAVVFQVDQRQRVRLARLFAAGLKLPRRKLHEFPILLLQQLPLRLLLVFGGAIQQLRAAAEQIMIQLCKVTYVRTGREEMPLGVLVHVLDHALFIARVGVAEAGLEAIEALQPLECLRGLALVSGKNLRHQRLVVVIDDNAGNSAEEKECLLVPLQPGFLFLEGEGHAEDGVGVAERHCENKGSARLAMQDDVHFKEIDLCLRHRLLEGNEDLLVLTAHFAD